MGGDEGPVSGVAQVDCHGVKVVGAHGEEGQEEDGEVRGEVKGEVEQLSEKRSSWMVWRWGDKRVNGHEPKKNAALSCSFNLNTFLASFHAASRAPNSCHSVSSRERSSNFGALGLCR